MEERVWEVVDKSDYENSDYGKHFMSLIISSSSIDNEAELIAIQSDIRKLLMEDFRADRLQDDADMIRKEYKNGLVELYKDILIPHESIDFGPGTINKHVPPCSILTINSLRDAFCNYKMKTDKELTVEILDEFDEKLSKFIEELFMD